MSNRACALPVINALSLQAYNKMIKNEFIAHDLNKSLAAIKKLILFAINATCYRFSYCTVLYRKN
ncbi:putative exported protein [Erwinia amylovora ATCC 49946]|nr:putative exported protein [Erwinia amylovora ATCC 49946]